jgi:Right handed beta helix region
MALVTVEVTEGVALTPSGPVQASRNGQVIERLDITAVGNTAGIRINGYSDVVVRNCRIRHATGRGIYATSSARLLIEDVDILCTGAPAAGQNPNSSMNNIETFGSPDAVIRRCRLRNGSAGLYALSTHRIKASFIEGYEFRGPFPRGQVVQFNQCTDPLLEEFSCENSGHVSWTEDNVNCYACVNPIVRRGFIRGNNSPSGQGVMIENTAGGSGGRVEDVDVVYWGNGALAAGEASSGVQFWRCRARDGMDNSPNNSVGRPDYQGNPIPDWAGFVGALARGLPISGSEAFFAYLPQSNVEFHDCQYFNLPRSGVAWDQNRMTVRQFSRVDFVPRAPIRLNFPWE